MDGKIYNHVKEILWAGKWKASELCLSDARKFQTLVVIPSSVVTLTASVTGCSNSW